jgi:hypothetical protein
MKIQFWLILSKMRKNWQFYIKCKIPTKKTLSVRPNYKQQKHD